MSTEAEKHLLAYRAKWAKYRLNPHDARSAGYDVAYLDGILDNLEKTQGTEQHATLMAGLRHYLQHGSNNPCF